MSNPPNLPSEDRSDAELALLVARRDAEEAAAAFRALHDRHARRVVAFVAARLDASAVEAVARGTWSDVWDALGDSSRFDGQDFGVLLRQVARDHLERPEFGPARIQHAGLAEAIERGMEGLHAGERAVVEARLGGLTFDEIAARAKSTADRAEKVFEVAMKKLNAILEPEPPSS